MPLKKAKVNPILTPVFRLSFPNLFEKKENQNGSSSYNITMIFEPDADFSKMKAIVQDVKSQVWGATAPIGLRLPFRKGVDKSKDAMGYDLEKRPEFAGKVICTAASVNQAPGVMNEKKQVVGKEAETDFYPGIYCIAEITAFAYDHKGNIGINFGLQNIMKIRDGESLFNRSKPEDAFAEIPASNLVSQDNSDLFDDISL